MVYISTFLNYVCFFVTTFGITYYLYNYFLKYYNKNIVNVVFWNILCEALGSNQFMTGPGCVGGEVVAESVVSTSVS